MFSKAKDAAEEFENGAFENTSHPEKKVCTKLTRTRFSTLSIFILNLEQK